MKKREKQAALLLALASGAAMAAALPLAALPAFGRWLRALSLSGGTGNLAAWGIALALTALPALGLLWRGRCGWDWLLVLAAGEIPSAQGEAVAALVSLGYSQTEAAAAIAKLDPALPVDGLIKGALKRLSRGV